MPRPRLRPAPIIAPLRVWDFTAAQHHSRADTAAQNRRSFLTLL